MSDLDFDRLAAELAPGLGRYLRRMVGHAETAEDLLQETLLKIARGLLEFEGRSSVRTWAYSIATRVAIDHVRRPEHRHSVVDIDSIEERADPAVGLDRRFVIDEMNTCIREVIDGLPEDYRAALVLHDLEGLTAQETADACGCSLATAKARIHRGRKRLEHALGDACTFYREDGALRCDRKPGDPSPSSY